jgi:hypothetical protein
MKEKKKKQRNKEIREIHKNNFLIKITESKTPCEGRKPLLQLRALGNGNKTSITIISL